MVELTMGGAWFKWDSLGRRDRKLAAVSLISSMLAVVPVALIAGDWAYAAGFRVGSGGLEPPHNPLGTLIASDIFPWLIAASVLLTLISAVAWWRFSANQDEMFNRIQNYAIAQGASWTLVAAFFSWLISLGGWVEPLPLGGVVIIGTVLVCGFWFRAVRRWA